MYVITYLCPSVSLTMLVKRVPDGELNVQSLSRSSAAIVLSVQLTVPARKRNPHCFTSIMYLHVQELPDRLFSTEIISNIQSFDKNLIVMRCPILGKY